jgi:hypothetical protein
MRVAQAIMGGQMMREAYQREMDARNQAVGALAGFYGGGGPSTGSGGGGTAGAGVAGSGGEVYGPNLPMGMANNNPANIKFTPNAGYAGALGASRNTDQGDPQLVFDNAQNGMNAAMDLALRKYRAGKTSANALIAGEGGWTPGNKQAAANIARSIGIDPDADLGLADPARARAFLQALVRQEQGAASGRYPTDIFTTAALRAGGRPRERQRLTCRHRVRVRWRWSTSRLRAGGSRSPALARRARLRQPLSPRPTARAACRRRPCRGAIRRRRTPTIQSRSAGRRSGSTRTARW